MKLIRAETPSRLEAIMQRLGYAKDGDYFERCLSLQEKGERDVFIVLHDDGTDIGYGMLNWAPRYNVYGRLGIPEIQDLNVLHEYRRQGAATLMIKHCEALARDKECHGIGISVGLTADYGAAQILYARMGYLPDGQGISYNREALKHGDRVTLDDDLCLMMLKMF